MCVICISDTKRPTPVAIEKMYDANPAGAGIAWREDGFVRWEKGLELKQIQELVLKVPMPFIAHFRIPSCGGKSPDLCHPFPIHKEVSLALSGKTKDWVLFHNGHWGAWKTTALEAAIKKGQFKLPTGKWTDSRAMAWLANVYGQGILDLIDEKVAVLGPAEGQMEVWQGTGGWHKIDDVYVSNRGWEYRSVSTTSYNPNGHFNLRNERDTGAYDDTDDYFQRAPYSMAGRSCVGEAERVLKDASIIEVKTDNEGSGGSPAEKTFPSGQETQERKEDHQKNVQGSEESVSAGTQGASQHKGSIALAIVKRDSPNERDELGISEEDRQELRKWACSINDYSGVDRVRHMKRIRQGVM